LPAPAANALLALVGWLAAPHIDGDVTSLLVGAIWFTNAFVAGFNLLPGLPLDGGFLVDSLVWRITGKRESGLIAAGWCGRVVTVLVVMWFLGLPLLNGQRPGPVQRRLGAVHRWLPVGRRHQRDPAADAGVASWPASGLTRYGAARRSCLDAQVPLRRCPCGQTPLAAPS